jgi:di-heme oxidoreductase (putative peroxidase)
MYMRGIIMTGHHLFNEPGSGVRDPGSGFVNPKRTTNPGQRIPTPKKISPLLQSKTPAHRSGAESCTLAQPDFATELANRNIIFRIPTPVFGAGLKTGSAKMAALAYKDVNLYSDLLLHDMGTGLSDGVSQGEAGPREFRTAPLWGLGQRIFFLHDGRASDLITAIRAHQSVGSEANVVVSKYTNLTEKQKQDLLNFLRSL